MTSTYIIFKAWIHFLNSDSHSNNVFKRVYLDFSTLITTYTLSSRKAAMILLKLLPTLPHLYHYITYKEDQSCRSFKKYLVL